jgi:hypothetical protein
MVDNQIERPEIAGDTYQIVNQTVEHMKKAYEALLDAANEDFNAITNQAEAAHIGGSKMWQTAARTAVENVIRVCRLGEQLIRTHDIEQGTHLKIEFLETQMLSLVKQAKEFGEGIAKGSTAAAKLLDSFPLIWSWTFVENNRHKPCREASVDQLRLRCLIGTGDYQ